MTDAPMRAIVVLSAGGVTIDCRRGDFSSDALMGPSGAPPVVLPVLFDAQPEPPAAVDSNKATIHHFLRKLNSNVRSRAQYRRPAANRQVARRSIGRYKTIMLFRNAMRILLLGAMCATARSQSTQPSQPATGPSHERHVLVISIDGMRPDVLLRADAPNIRQLMTRGSFTLWARTTPQSITLPSHVSMLTGVSPSAHGIEWNADIPLQRPVYPAFPTLFQLAKKAGYSTGMVAGKSKFISLTPPESLDCSWITPVPACEDPEVAEHAVSLIETLQPEVLFVHFPTVDNVGHAVGWGTAEQIKAVQQADAGVGRVIDALEKIGRLESTLIIVSADHGGAGRNHGPDDPRSRTIPWIAAGPGVRPNYDLTRFGKEFDIQTYDTFSTACYFLGITPPRRVEGKPIREMFDDAELTKPAPPKARAPSTQVH